MVYINKHTPRVKKRTISKTRVPGTGPDKVRKWYRKINKKKYNNCPLWENMKKMKSEGEKKS